jgi:hypothetical protein
MTSVPDVQPLLIPANQDNQYHEFSDARVDTEPHWPLSQISPSWGVACEKRSIKLELLIVLAFSTRYFSLLIMFSKVATVAFILTNTYSAYAHGGVTSYSVGGTKYPGQVDWAHFNVKYRLIPRL